MECGFERSFNKVLMCMLSVFVVVFLFTCAAAEAHISDDFKCYNTAGTEIPCPGTGQDGDGITTVGGYRDGALLLRNSSTNGLDDIFNGNRLDLTKWDPFPYGAATISTGSGLRFSLNGAQNYSTVQVFTLYQFSGDFDAQVDFTLGSGWNTPFPVNDTSPQLNGGGIAVYLDEPNWMVISRSRFPNSEGFNFYSKVDSHSKFSPSTATSGSLRIVASGGTYHFLFNQGSEWVELATAPAWNQPVRLILSANNVNAHVSFSSTLNNFRISSGSTDYQPYQLPGTFVRRPAFMIGGWFVNATLDRYFSNLTGYNPMSQLFAQGMSLARGCMTTVSDPDLASNPPAQWYTLGWKTSYWSSLQMTAQLFRDAMAAGMRINACFYLSDNAAHAGLQDAPMAWRNLSVIDTAALLEQYMYDTTTYLINQGIQVDLYDIGNEILFGILNFRPGDRITIPTGTDITRSISYLTTSVWPTEATLLTAAIRGVRRADPKARIVLHIESLLSPGMDTAFAFFQTMHSLGVPYDVAAISLPYMDYTNLSDMTAQEYFQRFNYLVNRIASQGKPVYIAENSYPAATIPAFNPPMPNFPYTEAGQAAYVNSQLRWASNNQNIIGWSWFYPEWFPGINPSAPANLVVQGLYRDRQTLRSAAAELNVALPNCPVLTYPHSQAFIADGGDGIVAVTSGAGCLWTGSSNASWITITSGASGSGNGTVTYSVAANADTSSRTGTLIIAELTFTVTQGGSPYSIALMSPSDQTPFSACSLYSLPSFSWDSSESLKSYEIQFSSSDAFSSIPAKVKASATEVQISSTTWKKILLIPGATGGSVYWKAVGTRPDKTQAESNVFSVLIESTHQVDNPQISPTSKSSLPALSWTNHCNMKFKVWFGNNSQFSKNKPLSFSLKTLSETFTKALTPSQWSSVRKLVGDAAGATIYWYVESWDGLGRYAKTDVMSFVLTD